MKKIITEYYLVFILLFGMLSMIVLNSRMEEENTKLKEKVAALEVRVEEQKDTIIERNGEITNLESVCNDWKWLFYSAIDYQPNEGPDW